MNDDQTNGTFVLPAGTADTILTAASESNFTGINLSGIYGTILNDTDRDYTSTTFPNPFATDNPWTNIPVDANLLDFFVAFTGLSSEISAGNSTDISLPSDNNSLAISPTGVFRVPNLLTVSQTISAVSGNDITVPDGSLFLVGDTIISGTKIAEIMSIATNVITLVAQPVIPFQVSDIITTIRRTVNRDASPVLSVSTNEGTSIYTVGTANTAGNGQLMSEDFANSGMVIGDIVTFSGMGNSVNDGTFIITDLSTSGVPTISVLNASGASEVSASGTAILGQKRRITGYDFQNGQITALDSPFRDIPLFGN